MKNLMEKSVRISVCAALIGSLFTFGTYAKDGGMTGDGSAEDPYIIEDAADLASFRDIVNGEASSAKCAALGADIDLGGAEWTPFAPASGYVTEAYAGTFDGAGHKITGLYVNAEKTNQGLFGVINGAVIKDLEVEGSVYSTKAYVGGIVGKVQQGTVQNCGFSGSVSTGATGSSGYAGGICGYAGNSATQTATISGCVNSASVNGGVAGGITGWAKYTSVTDCYNTGDISGVSRSGGIAGQLQNNCTAENCYNIGSVKKGEADGSDICDFLYSSATLKNCCYKTQLTGGGTGKAENCYDITQVSDLASALGSAFVADENNINNGYPVLAWQAGAAPAVRDPKITITGPGKLYMSNNGIFPTAALSVQYTDVDADKGIIWSTPSDIITLSKPVDADENNSSVIVTANAPGIAEIDAVTDGGLSAEFEISVYPFVTTAELAGDIRVGGTVRAKISTYGGAEYDTVNYPALDIAWKYVTKEDYANGNTTAYNIIQGAKGYEFVPGAELEGCYLTYEFWLNNEKKAPSRPQRIGAEATKVTVAGIDGGFEYGTEYSAETDAPEPFTAAAAGYVGDRLVYTQVFSSNAAYNSFGFTVPEESGAQTVRIFVWSKDGMRPLLDDVYEITKK